MRRLFSVLFLSILLLGCATRFEEKQSESAREGVYGIPAAIDNGRIDKADSLSQSLKTLYSAPKYPIESNPVINPTTGLPYVILPARLAGQVVVLGTSQYQDLLKNKSINQQLSKDNKTLIDYQKATEAQKKVNDRIQDDLLKQMNEYKASIFYKAYVKWIEFKWILGSGIVLSIIGFLVLIFAFPEAAPVVLTFLGRLTATLWIFIKGIFSFFLQFLKK